jgi:putative transcriptional regulator
MKRMSMIWTPHEPLVMDDTIRQALEEAKPRVPEVTIIKRLRRMLALTQEEFADRYSIPLEVVKSWERGLTEPDPASQVYLEAIARDPWGMKRALEAGDPPTG